MSRRDHCQGQGEVIEADTMHQVLRVSEPEMDHMLTKNHLPSSNILSRLFQNCPLAHQKIELTTLALPILASSIWMLVAVVGSCYRHYQITLGAQV